VLGGNRNRITEAQSIRLGYAGKGCSTLGLIGDKNDGFAGPPKPIGEMAIGLGNAFARIDDEQAYIHAVERPFRLRLHARGKREWCRLLEPGRVDDPETEICDPAFAFTAVTGHPGCIVDERQPPADQPVEECGLADVRPSENCNRKAHRDATAPLVSSTIGR